MFDKILLLLIKHPESIPVSIVKGGKIQSKSYAMADIICHHRVTYYLYVNDMQFHILTLGQTNVAVEVLSQCLDTIRVWMRRKRLRFSPNKIECLGQWQVKGPTSHNDLPSLILDSMALPHIELVCNLVIFLVLGSCSSCMPYISSWIRRPFFVTHILTNFHLD